MPVARAASRHSDSPVSSGCPARHVLGVQLLGEVVGAHHEHGEPVRGGRDLLAVQHRRRGLDHRPERGVLRRSGGLHRGDQAADLLRRADLGHDDRVGSGRAAARRSASCHCVPMPLTRIVELAPAVLTGPRCGTGVVARRLLRVGGDGVLEVEDQRVDREGLGLLQGPLVGGGHVEDRTTRTVCRGARHVRHRRRRAGRLRGIQLASAGRWRRAARRARASPGTA